MDSQGGEGKRPLLDVEGVPAGDAPPAKVKSRRFSDAVVGSLSALGDIKRETSKKRWSMATPEEVRTQASKSGIVVDELAQSALRADFFVQMTPEQKTKMRRSVIQGLENAGVKDVSEDTLRWVSGATLVAGASFASLSASLVGLDVLPTGKPVPAAEILLGRAVVSIVISVLVCRKEGRPVVPEEAQEGEPKKDGHLVLPGTLALMFMNGLISVFVTGTFYFALARLPVGIALVVSFTDPFFCGLFGRLFLGEDFGGKRLAFTSLSILGAVISVAPWQVAGGAASIDISGLVAACLNSVLQGLKLPCARKASQGGAHWSQQTLACGVAVLVVWVIAAPVAAAVNMGDCVFARLNMWSLLLTILITLCSFGAQACNMLGVGGVPAAIGAVISQLCIVFGVVWGVLLLGQMPTAENLLGATLLVVAGLLMTFYGK